MAFKPECSLRRIHEYLLLTKAIIPGIREYRNSQILNVICANRGDVQRKTTKYVYVAYRGENGRGWRFLFCFLYGTNFVHYRFPYLKHAAHRQRV